MLVDLFSLFNSVLNNIGSQEWFLALIGSACLFGIGCLIKLLLVKESV